MKEFEKWWEDFNRIPLPADEFDFARLAWKAALKWVYNYPYGEESVMGDDDTTAFDIIERELKN
ncbi:hypothetical protein LCGC14_1718660 [marine sediment metagenome]|uniref:Uncharacterized protein n=1 Tax=marine sediment metagenome TaxID=412755 RepID=A0A0F9JTJ7_9ZZZZ